jgi:D-sedoheptulose 7-phosphate isomerase
MSTPPPTSRAYLQRLIEVCERLDDAAIDRAVALLHRAVDEQRQVLVFGNGGSALTASHYITDWTKMTYVRTNRRLRALCLNDNLGLVTAYANDVSYADVFTEQLKLHLEPGDLVIAISGSGNSDNVLRAVNYANANGAITLGVVGFDGGRLIGKVHHAVHVPVNDMQIAEDVHLVFGHIVMQSLCHAPKG